MTYYIANIPCSDGDLCHYGIKGMKWGVRRTPEQLGHRRAARLAKRKAKKTPPTHDELLKSTNPKQLYKYRSQLSDKELRNRVNRINTERELKQLSNTRNFGSAAVHKLLSRLGGGAVNAVSDTVIIEGKRYSMKALAKLAAKAAAV